MVCFQEVQKPLKVEPLHAAPGVVLQFPAASAAEEEFRIKDRDAYVKEVLAAYEQDQRPWWVSLIPVYGPALDAIDAFEQGNYVLGGFNVAVAVSDLFVVKALFRAGASALGKAAWRGVPGRAARVFHHTNKLDAIYDAGRVLGTTEGRVYAAPWGRLDSLTRRLRMGLWRRPRGCVHIVGDASRLFQRHPVEGWYSGLKFLCGQRVTTRVGFDIVFDARMTYRLGKTLRIAEAALERQALRRFVLSNLKYATRVVVLEWGVSRLHVWLELGVHWHEGARRE